MARTQGAKDTKPRARSAESSNLKGIVADQNPNLPQGYNTRRIAFMQAILPTEPLDHDDVEEMERRFQNYLVKKLHSISTIELYSMKTFLISLQLKFGQDMQQYSMVVTQFMIPQAMLSQL